MIYIVDDFYHNPDEIRKQALKLEYVEGITADKRRGHTGERAKNPNNSNMVYLRNKFQAITGKKIVEFKYDTSIDIFTAYKRYIASKPWVSTNYLRDPTRKPEWV